MIDARVLARAIAFELLTGRRPSGTGADIGPLTGATVPIRRRLQAVLARAMAEDPADRFATGLALADALAAAGARGHVPRRRPSPRKRTTAEEADATEAESGPLTEAGSADPDDRAARRTAGLRGRTARARRRGHDAVAVRRRAVRTGRRPRLPRPRNRCNRLSRSRTTSLAEREEDEAHWALTRDEDAALASGHARRSASLEAAEFAPDDAEAAAADALQASTPRDRRLAGGPGAGRRLPPVQPGGGREAAAMAPPVVPDDEPRAERGVRGRVVPIRRWRSRPRGSIARRRRRSR